MLSTSRAWATIEGELSASLGLGFAIKEHVLVAGPLMPYEQTINARKIKGMEERVEKWVKMYYSFWKLAYGRMSFVFK